MFHALTIGEQKVQYRLTARVHSGGRADEGGRCARELPQMYTGDMAGEHR